MALLDLSLEEEEEVEPGPSYGNGTPPKCPDSPEAEACLALGDAADQPDGSRLLERSNCGGPAVTTDYRLPPMRNSCHPHPICRHGNWSREKVGEVAHEEAAPALLTKNTWDRVV